MDIKALLLFCAGVGLMFIGNMIRMFFYDGAVIYLLFIIYGVSIVLLALSIYHLCSLIRRKGRGKT